MNKLSKSSKLYTAALEVVVEKAVARGLYNSDKSKARKHLRTWTPYQIVCDWLGFSSAENFVTLNRGRVGFSCGKPEEIYSLRRECARLGAPMTAALKNFSR